MKRRRKGVEEKRQEWEDAKSRAWNEFCPQLEALQSRAAGWELFSRVPPPDSPGRGYYANLRHFIEHLSPPGGATSKENALYIALAQKMEEKGELKSAQRQAIEEALKKAISERPW
jgi:hypothetical protein